MITRFDLTLFAYQQTECRGDLIMTGAIYDNQGMDSNHLKRSKPSAPESDNLIVPVPITRENEILFIERDDGVLQLPVLSLLGDKLTKRRTLQNRPTFQPQRETSTWPEILTFIGTLYAPFYNRLSECHFYLARKLARKLVLSDPDSHEP